MAAKPKRQRKKPSRANNGTGTVSGAGVINSFRDKLSPLPVALVTIAVLFIIQSAFFVSSYQTNDDIGMTFVVSGTGTTPEPDEHLRYSHVFIGFFLKTLYSVLPDVPWYGLYHMAVHFLSMCALLYAVLAAGFTLKRFLFFLLYFFAVELYFLNELQFTITAFVAGQAGVFLFLAGPDKPPLRSWIMTVTGILFLMLSSMIRPASCYLALLLALPVLILAFRDTKKLNSARTRFAIFVVGVAVTVSGLTAFDKYYYHRDPEWRNFFAVNKLKSRFIDWQHAVYTEETKPVFDEVGWSQNDFYMLLTWFYADETLYSKENLEKVLSNFPSFKSYLSPAQVVTRLTAVLGDAAYILALALFFLLFSLGSKRVFLSLTGTTALMAVLMLYLIYTKRLPSRVYYPMFSFIAVTSLYHTGEGQSANGYWKRFAQILLGVIVVLWIGVVVSNQHSLGSIKLQANRQFKQLIDDLNPRGERLFVVWGASLPYTHILPFDNLDYLKNLKLVSLGTTLRTPITEERLKEFGVDDIYRAIYEKSNVLLVVQDLRYLYYYSRYILEHYDTKIQYRYAYRTTAFSIVQVIDESNPEYRENVEDKKIIDPYR